MVSADEVAEGLGEVLNRDVKAFAVPRAGWAEAFEQFAIPKGQTGLAPPRSRSYESKRQAKVPETQSRRRCPFGAPAHISHITYNVSAKSAASPSRTMASSHIFRIMFVNQGKVYEVYARRVSHGELFGFIEVEELLFGERSSVVLDPSEERIKASFPASSALSCRCIRSCASTK